LTITHVDSVISNQVLVLCISYINYSRSFLHILRHLILNLWTSVPTETQVQKAVVCF